ncbi:MAG: flagellar hook-length control protein FliK, partial [SAR324 cluster bacterium]|nr:flagellar hook-length control protein FliK [SAR324 cluster bacterium]
WMIRNNRSEVTLKLHPARLGELKIRVRQDDALLRVDITVDNVSVKRLIESHLNDLQTQLKNENLAGGDLIFNVDVRQEGGFQRPPETAEIPPGGFGPALGRETELEQTPSPHLSRPLWGRFGVGIYA